MERPSALYVPALHAGQEVTIGWDSVDGAAGYTLQRSPDGAIYATVYSGPATQYADTIPFDAQAYYRVNARPYQTGTWKDIEAIHHTWAEWDALGGFWTRDPSDWTVSGPHEIISNTGPTISGQDEDLGNMHEAFSITFSVSDPDPNDVLVIVATLNGTEVLRLDNAVADTNYAVQITGDQLAAIGIGSRGTIVISATDRMGESDTRTYTFTVVEDIVSGATFYVIRDGEPVANIGNAREWTDYMVSGTHTYMIRAVDESDNFTDSNVITITLNLSSPVIATVDDPENILRLFVRVGSRPDTSATLALGNVSQVFFEGREYPVTLGTGAKTESRTLEFSTIDETTYRALMRLIGVPIIYRDHFGDYFVGIIPTEENGHVARVSGRFDHVSNFEITINREDWSYVIEYD